MFRNSRNEWQRKKGVSRGLCLRHPQDQSWIRHFVFVMGGHGHDISPSLSSERYLTKRNHSDSKAVPNMSCLLRPHRRAGTHTSSSRLLACPAAHVPSPGTFASWPHFAPHGVSGHDGRVGRERREDVQEFPSNSPDWSS